MAGRTVKGMKSEAQKEVLEFTSLETQNGGNEITEENCEEAVAEEAMLIAVYPILYLSKQYAVGEQLPASDHGMVEAWINAGTASWKGKGME